MYPQKEILPIVLQEVTAITHNTFLFCFERGRWEWGGEVHPAIDHVTAGVVVELPGWASSAVFNASQARHSCSFLGPVPFLGRTAESEATCVFVVVVVINRLRHATPPPP